MSPTDEVVKLLTEIRDSNNRIIIEYSRLANESLDIQKAGFTNQQAAISQQQKSIDIQLRQSRIYKKVLLVAAIFGVFFIWRLFSLGL